MNNINLTGKTAVVTGASGGIGGALVKKLAQYGVFCILLDKSENPNLDLSLLIKENKAEYFSVDLTKITEIDKFSKTISEKFSKIDYLYNVAGVGIYKGIEDLSIDEWNLSLNLNLTAPYYLVKKLITLLIMSNDPLVFNIGSGVGVYPSGGRIAYCSSKFGLRGLTLSLAKEFKNRKIKFQLLTLGSVMTNFGTGGIEHRKDLQKKGKKYLTPDIVSDRIIELTLDKSSPTEVKFYPEGYGKDNI